MLKLVQYIQKSNNFAEYLSSQQKQKLQSMYVDYAEQYVNLFQPRYFFPFAGRYTLAGKLSSLNEYKGAYELEEAYNYFKQSSRMDLTKNECILLNSQEYFLIQIHPNLLDLLILL